MAVKFSDFTEATDSGTVEKIVGYTSTGDLNLQIPPANLDTTYVVSNTGGAAPTVNLTATKAGSTPTSSLLNFTGSGGTTLTGVASTSTINISSVDTNTTYTIPVTAISNSAVMTLTGSDSSTDAVTITAGANLSISSLSAAGFTLNASDPGVTNFTNANGTYISAGTANVNATGEVTLGTIDLSATNGTSDSSTRFLSQDNTWDVPSYTAAGTGVFLPLAGGTMTGNTIINDDIKTIYGTSGGLEIYRSQIPAESFIVDTGSNGLTIRATPHIKIQSEAAGNHSFLECLTSGTNEYVNLYFNNLLKLSTATTGITITGKATSTATVAGDGATTLTTKGYVDALDTGVTSVATANANLITIAGGGSTPFTGAVTVTANVSAVSSLSSNLATGSAIQQAISTAVANVGAFQGAYDAATNTPDLDVAPSSAIQNGWFWAVTVAGTFFTENVQIGDFIFANQDNPGATFANWTVIQSGQDIAGSGSTDANTVKGVAGFNSADFDVTSNGWVEAKDFTGTTPGYVPTSANPGDQAKFLKGDGSWAVPTNSGGTVTSVGLTTNVAAFTVGSTPVTGSGNITLNRNGGTAGQFLRQDGTWAATPNNLAGGYLPLAGGTLTGGLTINHSSGESLLLTKTTTEPSLRFEGDTNKDFVLTVSGETFTITQNDGGTDILSLDHDTKNSTFAGKLTASGGIARTSQGASTNTDGINFWSGDQAAYDGLTPNANTIYYVTP